jgi:hypothetical protein
MFFHLFRRRGNSGAPNLAQDLEAHYFTENEIEEENVKKERKQ